MANSNYMMSESNPFGVRPDELVGAISGGYVTTAPTVSQVQTAVNAYNSSSSVPYSASETSYFNRLANYLNDNVKSVAQAVTQPVQQVAKNATQVVAQPIPQITLPNMPGQQLTNPVNNVVPSAGISSDKIEQYLVLGVLFLVVSSILSLFRR